MMKHLYLSHWKDEREVYIESKFVKNMKPHHYLAVRFLYNFYKNKQRGVVLNYDDGMNFPFVIQLFLSAIYKNQRVTSPILILAGECNVQRWDFHLKQTGMDITTVNNKNCKDVFEKSEPAIVLTSLSDLNVIHPYRNEKFDFVIVDQFDTVASKMVFKKLSGNFNVGLTNRDFMENRDQKLLWKMLNWTNPKLFGKMSEFAEKDDDHLRNLRDPYDDVWQRLSWDMWEGLSKESEEKVETYKQTTKDLPKKSSIKSGKSAPQKSRKRKLPEPPKKGKKDNVLDDEIIEETQALLDDICEELTAKHNNFTRKCQRSYPKLAATKQDSVRRVDDEQDFDVAVTEKLEEIDDSPLLTAIIKGSPLKVENLDVSNSSTADEDEGNILLTIMEGKFSASQVYSKKTSTLFDDVNKSNTQKYAKHNSKSILTSLFGDEAEYIRDDSPKLPSQDVHSILEDGDNTSIFNHGVAKSSNFLNSLFDNEDDIITEDNSYKLSESQRNALMSSLFDD